MGKRMKRRKRAVLLWLLLILFAAGFFVLFFHGNYPQRILARLGLAPEEAPYAHPADPRTVAGWDRCLEQLEIDADVVFFGDSITYQSDFAAYFPDLKICNFGVVSDTLEGMIQRAYTLRTVRPEKVFFLGGINSLRPDNSDEVFREYEFLVDYMRHLLDAEIYLISILPISRDRVDNASANEIIQRFNERIAALAEARGLKYIDLASLFLLDGEMNPAYTIDGVHLSAAGFDVWASVLAGYLE